MNKYVIIPFLLLAVSCAPKKVITQSKTDNKTEAKTAIADTKTSESKEVKAIVDQSATDTETTTHITTYDNDKPIDTITGKHPVKEEKVIVAKKVKKADVKTDINTSNRQLNSHLDNSVVNTDSTIEIKAKEMPKTPAVKYYLYLAVLLIGSFLVWKYFDKIKLLFAFLFKK